MKKIAGLAPRFAVLLALGATVTACDAPRSGEDTAAPLLSSAARPTLLQCRTDEARSSRGRIDSAGGSISLGGHAVVVPGGAVASALEISIEVPVSDVAAIELEANGEEHWQFLAPVTVTIDYSHCPDGQLNGALSVYHVDLATGQLLEDMGAVDNRHARTITFTTDHFSGYAIAN